MQKLVILTSKTKPRFHKSLMHKCERPSVPASLVADAAPDRPLHGLHTAWSLVTRDARDAGTCRVVGAMLAPPIPQGRAGRRREEVSWQDLYPAQP